MLAFEHWGLSPERDNIQFRLIGDQGVMAQALTQNIIDGAYLGYTFGAQLERQGYRVLADLATLGIPYQGLGVMARRSLLGWQLGDFLASRGIKPHRWQARRGLSAFDPA